VQDHDGPKRRRSREEMRRIYMRRRAVLAGSVGLIALVIALAVTAPSQAPQDALSVVTQPTEAEAAAAERERAGRTIDRVLRHTSYVVRGRPTKRRVALTFDDGPGPDTGRILRILERNGARGTFFNLGIQVARYPELVERQLSHGHTVAGHTNDHARMSLLPRSAQREQLELQDAAYAAIGVEPARLFRPPYGAFDSTTLDLLERRRSLMVLWSVDTGDFASPGAEVIAQRVLDEAAPGAIILMHDGPGPRPHTVEALPIILAGLKARNLKPVTVPRLLRINPPRRNQPPPSPLDGPG
jgi:peptidoglycan-N-acetylglucosamine deacetylase